jgi:hypothetical protein
VSLQWTNAAASLGRSGGPQHREAARRAQRATARARAQELTPVLADLRSQGVASLRGIARAFEERGFLTADKERQLVAGAGLPRARELEGAP